MLQSIKMDGLQLVKLTNKKTGVGEDTKIAKTGNVDLRMALEQREMEIGESELSGPKAEEGMGSRLPDRHQSSADSSSELLEGKS